MTNLDSTPILLNYLCLRLACLEYIGCLLKGMVHCAISYVTNPREDSGVRQRFSCEPCLRNDPAKICVNLINNNSKTHARPLRCDL